MGHRFGGGLLFALQKAAVRAVGGLEGLGRYEGLPGDLRASWDGQSDA
jgi:hypothetical protein